ncbi:MAG: enoyl-CoA hydratase/isomerase family protein [candidate division WOR-3 bacterium]|nr:MAG: enoyl-CoA hydratase/isomerase family protein [candidate division WOR-3 bacterium]
MKCVDAVVQEKVAVVKLSRNVTNAINLDLIREIADYLQSIKNDKEIAGVVLTSGNDKFFSIGFDIPALIKLGRKDFKEFYEAFNGFCIDLYSYPKPVVAAIIGHAVAGGCILTVCCDYRFIAEGKKFMGLNEIKLGVPLPYPADCILRQLVHDRFARTILDTGDFFLPEATFKMGLVDEIMPLAQVIPASVEKIRAIDSLSLDAFRTIKRNRTEGVVAQIQTTLTDKEKMFIELWYTDATRKKLEAALEKF